MGGGNCNTIPDTVYTDVTEEDWYYSYVVELSESGIINVYDDGTPSAPEDNVTYAQALKLLLRTAGFGVHGGYC